jgi:hypothetical protein
MPQRGTASYGYYEEVRIIPDEPLSQPGMLIGVGPGLCGLPRISTRDCLKSPHWLLKRYGKRSK